jgi:hypothetical protein
VGEIGNSGVAVAVGTAVTVNVRIAAGTGIAEVGRRSAAVRTDITVLSQPVINKPATAKCKNILFI